MSKQDWKQSQYYQEDFLASHSVQPGSDEARRMTVTSGLKCLELYKKSDPVGLLVRMLLESSRWRSTLCFLTWKVSATPAKRLLFRLVPSMPNTGAIDAQLLPTPTTPRPHDNENTVGKYFPSQKQKDLTYAVAMWPTPRANDAEKRGNVSPDPRNGLPGAVRMWPTPTSAQCGMTATTGGRPLEKSTHLSTQVYLAEQGKLFPTPRVGGSKGSSPAGDKHGDLAARVGGQLNPAWVEWLMGFPIGWTDLDASETP